MAIPCADGRGISPEVLQAANMPALSEVTSEVSWHTSACAEAACPGRTGLENAALWWASAGSKFLKQLPEDVVRTAPVHIQQALNVPIGTIVPRPAVEEPGEQSEIPASVRAGKGSSQEDVITKRLRRKRRSANAKVDQTSVHMPANGSKCKRKKRTTATTGGSEQVDGENAQSAQDKDCMPNVEEPKSSRKKRARAKRNRATEDSGTNLSMPQQSLVKSTAGPAVHAPLVGEQSNPRYKRRLCPCNSVDLQPKIVEILGMAVAKPDPLYVKGGKAKRIKDSEKRVVGIVFIKSGKVFVTGPHREFLLSRVLSWTSPREGSGDATAVSDDEDGGLLPGPDDL